MNLLHNMTVNTLNSADVLCPAELESESLAAHQTGEQMALHVVLDPGGPNHCQTSDACLLSNL